MVQNQSKAFLRSYNGVKTNYSKQLLESIDYNDYNAPILHYQIDDMWFKHPKLCQ